eukprot:7983043-Alexandrium_andersonii.AAC.1
MSASLVGSEMCIRDSPPPQTPPTGTSGASGVTGRAAAPLVRPRGAGGASRGVQGTGGQPPGDAASSLLRGER